MPHGGHSTGWAVPDGSPPCPVERDVPPSPLSVAGRVRVGAAGWREGGSEMAEQSVAAAMPDEKTIAGLFKAYDVRGAVPKELTPEVAYRIGRALVIYLQ